jgi:hypothetical protein
MCARETYTYKSLGLLFINIADMDLSISNFSIPFTSDPAAVSLSVPSSGEFDKVRIETLLADVHPDDKVIILNVFAIIDTLRPYKLVRAYKIINTKKGYDVVGQLCDSSDTVKNTNDVIISVQDLDMIVNMNPARIASCVIQIPANAPPKLIVRVLRSDQAIVYNDVQISHVIKKARWW